MSYNLILTILSIIYLVPYIFGQDLCPKVCSICFNDHLSCTNGGLQGLPSVIHESTTKITLIGHTFSSSILSKANFSRFAKPRYSIEQLSIRQSNIDTIFPNTFYDLSGLDNLDLSDNRKMVVQYMAFANLKLKHLKLDNIQVLILQKGAFDGLMVASLSMKQSRITTLAFELLLPISTNLRNLFLNNNHLRYLEPKFEHLFLHLLILDLTNNPFQCTCDLAWLGKVMFERSKRMELRESSFSSNEIYPTCVGPPHVRTRNIHNISEAEFSCTPPSLDIIDVKFESNGLVRLRCSAKMVFKTAPIQVVWQQLSENDSIRYPELQHPNTDEAIAFVKRSSKTNNYRCLAISNSGNATVKITITWPPSVNETNSLLDTRINDKADWFDKQQKVTEKNFFFKEQFTLLEMLGAVMGTFTVTLTAFLLLYRFCFRISNKSKKTNSTKKSGYSIYEPAVYNDSQTYDVPQNNYNIPPQPFINKTLPNNTPSHYIDYRTQQRITNH